MPTHRALLGVATVICAGALIAAGAAPATAELPLMPASSGDDLYTAPADLDAHAPGDVLKVRTRPAPFAVFAGATQIQFRSTDSQQRPIAAVATVFTPANAQPNAPVLVWDHSVNSLGLRCAPSQAMWSADPDVTMRETPALNAVLALGWSVIVPDHLGPTSAYGAARMGGQITLDAARAATRHAPLQMGSSRFAIAGYSGGAMSAAYAAVLADSYAPELPIVGAAIGGLPANIETMANALWTNRHPAFGIAAAVAFGLSREYPETLPVNDYLNPAGEVFRSQMNDACINEILRLGFGRSVNDFASSVDLFFAPSTRDVMHDNSIQFFDGAPRMPVFEWHSPTDALIPLAELDATMNNWRARGTSVTQVPVPTPDHLSAAVIGLPLAVQWLGGLFAQA
ncbi:lipase family protein [Nocardia asteroides]|uniref:lipase family protein n=1 Tax=Nocardia asteroides TaxID=1824 RepID=UPI0037CBD97C